MTCHYQGAKCHKVHPLLLVFLNELASSSYHAAENDFNHFRYRNKKKVKKKHRRQLRRSVRIVDIREGRGKRNNWPTFAEEWEQI